MISIRKATLCDITGMINLHKEIFDKSHFTSNFPSKLLARYFYKLISRNSFNYVAFDKNEILGYIVSGFHTAEAVQEFVSENKLAIIKVLLLHPKFLIEKVYISIFTHSRKTKNLRLLLIGVKPNQKIGSQLLKYFENEIYLAGIHNYGLSVRKNNMRAIDFYKKSGFIVESSTINSFSFLKDLQNDG